MDKYKILALESEIAMEVIGEKELGITEVVISQLPNENGEHFLYLESDEGIIYGHEIDSAMEILKRHNLSANIEEIKGESCNCVDPILDLSIKLKINEIKDLVKCTKCFHMYEFDFDYDSVYLVCPNCRNKKE